MSVAYTLTGVRGNDDDYSHWKRGGGGRSVSVIKAEKPPPGEMGKTLSNAIKEKQRNTASPPTHI